MIDQIAPRLRSPISYDSYYRCEVKSCSKCKLKQPLNQFTINRTSKWGYHTSCKRCDAAYRASFTKDEKKLIQRKQLANVKKNPEAYNQRRDRYVAKKGAQALKMQNKLAKIAREDKRGMSDHQAYDRSIDGRCYMISQYIKRYYGLRFGVGAVRTTFRHRPDYIAAYKAWAADGFSHKLRPIPYAPPDINVTELKQFKIIACNIKRAKTTQASWRRGEYDKRDNTRISAAGFEYRRSRELSRVSDNANGNDGQTKQGLAS